MSGQSFRDRQTQPPQVCQAGHHQGPANDPFSSVFEPGGYSPMLDDSWLDGLMAPGGGQTDRPQLEEPEIIQRMAEISAMEDPVARNFEITQMYQTTSAMMDQTLFPNADEQNQTANWSTFAIWASNEAGRAIRGEGNWFMGAANALAPQSWLDDSTQALARRPPDTVGGSGGWRCSSIASSLSFS